VVGPEKAAGPEPLDAVLVAASGCGHTLKGYGRILNSSTGEGFAAKVRDIHEFLADLGLSDDFQRQLQPLPHGDGTPATQNRPLRVAVHDACHMLHGQGIQAQPRQLLRQIPHLELREPLEAGVCCGSAGIYNLVQPQEAASLGRLKADDLAATQADCVASANIGCSLQIQRHLTEAQHPQTVAHPIELLDRSYAAGTQRR
ncbi:MAG: (Fe-S)-binding protein, partial [Vulcanococcus sp.]